MAPTHRTTPLKIRSGDQVQVMAGKDRGKTRQGPARGADQASACTSRV